MTDERFEIIVRLDIMNSRLHSQRPCLHDTPQRETYCELSPVAIEKGGGIPH